ncbi:MAG: hypothetical protein EKK62_17525 [Acidimicrobiia bacterium]|nr:MAG: hypothetical protein EKK62_17525 [Acidimicrobiia bacterium]
MGAGSVTGSAFSSLVAAVLVVVSTVLAPTASADVNVVLPPQKQTMKMGDGTVVTISRTGERATINPSMGGTPLHRNAWVSAKYRVDISKPTRYLLVRPGYLVGCQVNLGGGRVGGRDGSLRLSDGTIDDYDLYGGARNTLSLGPGEVARFFVYDEEMPDLFGADSHQRGLISAGEKSVRASYVNSQIGLRGCAGYAQARSWLLVIVETEFAQESFNFYGRPFSLG